MLLLGLTGSIATGKSTVSSILSSPPYSLPIIDADILARKVVEPGTPGYKKIVSHFLPTTPDLLLKAGEYDADKYPTTRGAPLNRPELGRRVFGDSEERKRDRALLNGIVHPAVRWELYKRLLVCYLRGNWAVVLDIPLLFESGLDKLCGMVMVVGVKDPEVQIRRLRARDAHLSDEEARDRVSSQGDIRTKARRAEFMASEGGRGVVVWNDGGKEDLEREVGNAMREVRRSSPRWWAWLLLFPPLAGLVGAWNFWRGLAISRRWRDNMLKEKAKL